MILFDYVYYLFAKLYRKSKDEREEDTWKLSGITIVALSFALFLTACIIPLCHYFFEQPVIDPIMAAFFLIGYPILFFIFYFYYRKKSFDRIEKKISKLTTIKLLSLWIATIIYLCIGVFGSIYVLFHFGGPQNQS